MTLRPLFVLLHRLVGLASGAIVFIVALSGAIYVWEAELFELAHRDVVLLPATSAGARLPVDTLVLVANAALAEGREVRHMRIPADPLHAVVLTARHEEPSASTYFSEMRWFDEVYIDPHSARVMGIVDRRLDPVYLLRMVHENLLLGDAGTYVVGTATLVFVALTLSGIVLWWPRNRRVLGTRLRPRITAGWKRGVYDGHGIFGIYLLPLLLILALTGPVWTWKWYEDAVAFLFTGEPHLTGEPVPSPLAGAIPVDQPMERALRATMREVPSATRYMVQLPGSKGGILTVGAVYNGGSFWEEYERYYFDPRSAALLGDERFEEKNLGMKWRNTNYGIHTGTLFGWPTQVAATGASLFAASLPLTGFLIWFPRWRRRRAGAAARTDGEGARSRPGAGRHSLGDFGLDQR